MSDDSHVLDGSPVEITFAGETYQLKQKPRKQQRRIREELCDIAAILASLNETEGDSAKLPIILRGVNRIIDFCEDHYPQMGDVESVALRDGLGGMTALIECVFNPLFEAWVSPYMPSGEEDTQKKTETATT